MSECFRHDELLLLVRDRRRMNSNVLISAADFTVLLVE